MEVKSFGPHLLIDMFGCQPETIKSVESIFNLLDVFPEYIGMQKITQPHVFRYSGDIPEDWGITGSVIIATSHISIHTFPSRDNFVTMDIYSCKDFDIESTMKFIRNWFYPQKVQTQLIHRGLGFDRST